MEHRLVVISPVRDEEKLFSQTIRVVTSQTLRPIEWVLVDDGSTDGTPDLIAEAAAKHPWITPVFRPNRGFRSAGSGVMEAFHEGLAHVRTKNWEFLVKLDGDLSFPEDYFQKCLMKFAANARLGIGGGAIRSPDGSKKKREEGPVYHVRGATKFYRRECWDEIGGLKISVGWDTLDEITANFLGWDTSSFPDIVIDQNRRTGGAYGILRDMKKNGYANYLVGYSPVFLIAKVGLRIFKPPFLVGALALLTGYIKGYVHSQERIASPTLIRYLRREQHRHLLGRPSIWSRQAHEGDGA